MGIEQGVFACFNPQSCTFREILSAIAGAFLATIDLASLRGSSENLSSDKHAGSADLVFEANLKEGGVTGLYVGIIAEHKSTNRDTERMAGIRSAKRGFRTIPNITTTSDFLSRWNSWMWNTPSTMQN